MEINNKYLVDAVTAGVESVNERNGGPFGAVIVTADGTVFTSSNSVTQDNDPTAHAEVNVIRLACKTLGTFNLSGSVLYSSCEPCPMCLGASLWARVDKVVFAADRYDAAAAGFDDAAFYEKLAQGEVAEKVLIPSYNAPFEAWEELASKTEY